MNRELCLSGLVSLVMAVNLHAGFEWTASNWTISALSEVNPPGPPAVATVTPGPTNGNLITANMFASASNVLPGTATAILTFSRSYTILEDFPGQPVEVHFQRSAIGSALGGGLGGNNGSYSLSSSVFNESFNPIFGGTNLNLDSIQSVMLMPGNYIFSGEFRVGSVRSSGPVVVMDLNVAVGFTPIPEPQFMVLASSLLGGLVTVMRQTLRHASRGTESKSL